MAIQSFPSTTLVTIIDETVSPTTFNIVAGASIIVAIIVSIGNAATGYPIILIISISDIVPPPIGTAVINKFASRATPSTPKISPAVDMLVPNSPIRNIILNTEPIIDPSLWKLDPNGIVVSAISSGTPIFLLHYIQAPLTAALQAMEQAKTAMKGTLLGMILRTLILFICCYFHIGLWALVIALSSNIIFVTLHQAKHVIKKLNVA